MDVTDDGTARGRWQGAGRLQGYGIGAGVGLDDGAQTLTWGPWGEQGAVHMARRWSTGAPKQLK